MCRYGRVGWVPLASSGRVPAECLISVLMSAFLLVANAKGIPYDTWWLVWALLMFIGAPLIAVAAVRRGRGRLGFVPFLVPLLAGVVILGIASNCHSFGLYGARDCSPTQAIVIGSVALGVALGIDVWIAVYLGRIPRAHRPLAGRHAYCRTCHQWLDTVEDHAMSHVIDWYYQPGDATPH